MKTNEICKDEEPSADIVKKNYTELRQKNKCNNRL